MKYIWLTVLLFASSILWGDVLCENVVVNKDNKNVLVNMIYPHFVGDGARGYNIVVEAKVNAIEKTFEKLVGQLKLKNIVSLDLYSHITCNSDRILSGLINAYSYVGGDHAQSSVEVFNFVDGAFVSFEDIFKDKEGLKKVILEKVDKEKERRGIKSSDFIFFDYFLRNFVLEGGLVTWAFDQGSVGQFDEGVYKISLTYDEIKPFLKENSPIDFYVNEPLKRVPCEFYLQVGEELPDNYETYVRLYDGDEVVAEVRGQKLRFSYGGDFSEGEDKTYTIVPEILFAGQVAYKAKENLKIDKNGLYDVIVEMEKVPGDYKVFRGFNNMGGDFTVIREPVYSIYDEKGDLWKKFTNNTGYYVFYYNFCGPKGSKLKIEAYEENKKALESQLIDVGEEPVFTKVEAK